MAFQQVHKGGTFGPGASFPEYCYFEGCTFYAQCTFAPGSIFKNCTFLKCCPKHYRNPNSIVKQAKMDGCYLEYITVDSESLVTNCSKGARATIQANENPSGKQTGNNEKLELCWCVQPAIDSCENDGISISPVESGKPKISNVEGNCKTPEKNLGYEAEKDGW